MFSLRSNASKIALSSLVAFCLHHGMPIIDCQQQTRHLASLGASPWPRDAFTRQLSGLTRQPPVPWQFDPIYWNALFNRPSASA
jgi:leucyl/phenylalanyl-tRNA--protein transferase